MSLRPRRHPTSAPGAKEVAGLPTATVTRRLAPTAKAAASALMENTTLDARAIAEKAMRIAGQICIFTNENITYEELG